MNILTAILMASMVFVTTPDGNIDWYYDMPSINVSADSHIEFLKGTVVDEYGNGELFYDSDGELTEPYTYISYGGLPVSEGDVVDTLLIIDIDEDGTWCDEITLRIDVIE